MPISNDSLNKKLYDLLKTQGFDPVPKNSKGDTTPVPNDADVFRFTFKVDGKPVGPAWVTVDSNQQLRVYYDDKTMGAIDEDEEIGRINDFTDFLKQLKKWAQRRQLGFDVENQDHLESDMAQREHTKKQEQINEGYYPMGKSASYTDSVPSVKIILQHTRQIQEGEQRFRNIARIFLENEIGERILAPTTRPGIAKVYARHLAEGGLPHDDRWGHITNLVEEYTKMAGFVRATRGNQFNESAQKLVNEGINHYQSLRETLSRMTGSKGYNTYFESWTPALMETEGDETSLNELFVQETLDPRIESVMPILNRIHKKVNEMSEVKDLEEWANKLIEGDSDEDLQEEEGRTSNNPQGIPEGLKGAALGGMTGAALTKSVKGAMTGAQIGSQLQDMVNGEEVDEGHYDMGEEYEDMSDRELMHHANMLGMEENIVPDGEGGLANRREIIYLLQQHLHDEDLEEGFGDIAKKVGGAIKKAAGKAMDTIAPGDEELLKDLQKRAGIPQHAQHGKPRMATPNDEVDEEDGAAQNIIGKRHEGFPRMSGGGAVPPPPKSLIGGPRFSGGGGYTGKGVPGQPGPAAKKTDEVEENLDGNQKRVGQLGPTEKVGKKGTVGKLVGANESVVREGQEDLDAILRIIKK